MRRAEKTFVNRESEYTRDETNAAKGVAVVLLLIHHLFYKSTVFAEFQIKSILIGIPVLHSFALWSKICLSIFTLLSGYGMAVQYIKRQNAQDKASLSEFCVMRYLKMITNFWFVYVIAFIVACFSERTPFSVYGGGLYGMVSAATDFMGLSSKFSTPTLNATWWFISAYTFLIAIFSVLFHWSEKSGIAGVAGCILLSLSIYSSNSDLLICIGPFIFGIYLAQRNLLFTVRNKLYTHPIFGWITLVFMMAVIAKIWLSSFYNKDLLVFRAVLAPVLSGVIVLFVYSLFRADGIIKRILAFLGSHSANIFMVHTFIYYYYGRGLVYSFKYAILIFIVTLLLSLLVSMAMEFLKRIIRFDRIAFHKL